MTIVRRTVYAFTPLFLAAVSAYGDVVARSNAAPSLAMAFQPAAVVVSGATPGSAVILFALAREPLHYASHTRKVYFSATADAAGAAQFALPAPVVRRSIYAAVDLETGTYAIATPGDFPVRVTPFPASALKKRGADFEMLDVETARLDAICVRPRKGAWRFFVLDGAGADRDGAANGRTLIEAAQMQRFVGQDDSPGKFRRHDVVIVVDATDMSVSATAVPE